VLCACFKEQDVLSALLMWSFSETQAGDFQNFKACFFSDWEQVQNNLA